MNSGVCRRIKLCEGICMCTDATVYMCIGTYIHIQAHTDMCRYTCVHKSILPNSDEYRWGGDTYLYVQVHTGLCRVYPRAGVSRY